MVLTSPCSAQTKTSLRLSSPHANKVVCLLSRPKFSLRSNLVSGRGLEPYRFSTPIGYFCSLGSKNISIGLQVRATLFCKKLHLLGTNFRFASLVPRRGLEPPSLAAYAPQAYAYTNSATWAILKNQIFNLIIQDSF